MFMIALLMPQQPLPTTLYRFKPIVVFERVLKIAGAFSKFGLALGADILTRRHSEKQTSRAQHLKTMLVGLGPTFIKLGQLLSCRPDLVPPVYARALTDLQDRVSPFSFTTACQTIESELGQPWEQVYAELDPDPVASASFGQVYKARLKTGEWVAVKIQRKGLQKHLTLDLFILRKLTAIYQAVLPFIHSDLVAAVDELTQRLLGEIDYIQEGRNAQTFARLYGHNPHIAVPRVYWRYTRRRILTMEWIEGIKITEGEHIRSWGIEPGDLIAFCFQFALQQLIEEGFLHSDPHPGNLLVTAEGKIAYLDFGMVSTIEPGTRDHMLLSFFHFVAEDFEGLAQDYVDLGFLPVGTDLSTLILQFQQAFPNIREANVTEFGFKQMYEQLAHLLYEYPIQMPDFYLSFLRCFATIEGIAIQLNPNLQAFEQIYPYLIQQLLTRQSPAVTTCLNQLLIQERRINWEQVSDLLSQFYPTQLHILDTLCDSTLELLLSSQGQSLRDTLVSELRTIQNQFWHQIRQEISLYVPGTLYLRKTTMELSYNANATSSLADGLSSLASRNSTWSPWIALLPRLASNPKTWQLMALMIQDLGIV